MAPDKCVQHFLENWHGNCYDGRLLENLDKNPGCDPHGRREIKYADKRMDESIGGDHKP